MIFVIFVMMFLMAIGVSTLSAAFANAGYIVRQSDFARVRLLHESIHENIMFSLQDDPKDEDMLGYQIAMAIFRANDPSEFAPGVPVPGLADITNMVINVDGTLLGNIGGRITVESVALSFPGQEQLVIINEAIPAVAQDPPNPTGVTLPPEDIITQFRPREPRTATLNASMIVEVVISSGDRTITSVAVYEYTGGRLTDDPTGALAQNPPPPVIVTPPMVFVPAVIGVPSDPGGYGIWSMVRHEILDW